MSTGRLEADKITEVASTPFSSLFSLPPLSSGFLLMDIQHAASPDSPVAPECVSSGPAVPALSAYGSYGEFPQAHASDRPKEQAWEWL